MWRSCACFRMRCAWGRRVMRERASERARSWRHMAKGRVGGGRACGVAEGTVSIGSSCSRFAVEEKLHERRVHAAHSMACLSPSSAMCRLCGLGVCLCSGEGKEQGEVSWMCARAWCVGGVCVRACARARACVCVCACVRACVHAGRGRPVRFTDGLSRWSAVEGASARCTLPAHRGMRIQRSAPQTARRPRLRRRRIRRRHRRRTAR